MVVQRLERALLKLRPRHLPQSPMGQAITYAINQWANLQRFLEHGEVEIDNNKVENAIRPTAVGKRNWLFFGSEEAGQRNAVSAELKSQDPAVRRRKKKAEMVVCFWIGGTGR
jgi:hypothetical protein